LLAEVYLAMTRGQETLTIGLDEPETGEQQRERTALAAERPRLRVLRATDAELAEHDKVLQDIAKKAKCLWLMPQAASAS